MSCCCAKETVIAEKAPKAIGPYSVAVKAGGFVFTSGQVGIDSATGAIVGGGIEAETRQVLSNIQAVLEAAGVGLKDVVKTTVFLKDMADFAVMNGIYAEYFNENPPARSAFQVAALPKGALIEIETIAKISCVCDCNCDCDCDEADDQGDECCCNKK